MKSSFENSSEFDVRALVEQVVKDAPQKISEECGRTSNSWIACFNTRLSFLSGKLHLIDKKGGFVEIVNQKLDKLVEKAREYGRKHPTRDVDVTDEVKSELISDLNDLAA